MMKGVTFRGVDGESAETIEEEGAYSNLLPQHEKMRSTNIPFSSPRKKHYIFIGWYNFAFPLMHNDNY